MLEAYKAKKDDLIQAEKNILQLQNNLQQCSNYNLMCINSSNNFPYNSPMQMYWSNQANLTFQQWQMATNFLNQAQNSYLAILMEVCPDILTTFMAIEDVHKELKEAQQLISNQINEINTSDSYTNKLKKREEFIPPNQSSMNSFFPQSTRDPSTENNQTTIMQTNQHMQSLHQNIEIQNQKVQFLIIRSLSLNNWLSTLQQRQQLATQQNPHTPLTTTNTYQ